MTATEAEFQAGARAEALTKALEDAHVGRDSAELYSRELAQSRDEHQILMVSNINSAT